MYNNRTLESFINRATGQFPVLLLTGARQVGKTTLLQHLSHHSRTYVTLDDPIILNLAKDDPALFMQRYTPPVLIDEIQYAPELLPYIKMAADKEQKPGMFWLTGSQQFQLMKGVSESLAGRVGIVQLMGFSSRETRGEGLSVFPFLPEKKAIQANMRQGKEISLASLYYQIWRGSFPSIARSSEVDHNLFYGSYIQTYLQRDVRDLAKVGDETAFLRFIRACAARTGQLLNLSNLARDADVAPNTAKAWLSILQTTGLVYLLEPFFSNVTKRLVKAPKLYFTDTGLCSYLTEWSSPETLEAGAMSGAILESWILSELLKSWLHNGKRAPFYYYRDRDKKEIDLLIVQDGTVYPLEFKKTASPRKDAVRCFALLDKLNLPIGTGGIICLCSQYIPLKENIFSIPITAI